VSKAGPRGIELLIISALRFSQNLGIDGGRLLAGFVCVLVSDLRASVQSIVVFVCNRRKTLTYLSSSASLLVFGVEDAVLTSRRP
jgi:hypothetical protein